MGLHTGLVVVGGMRNGDDAETAATVVGDVVSVATALEEQAAPGTILCSDATARLIQGTVRLEAMGTAPGPRAASTCRDLHGPRQKFPALTYGAAPRSGAQPVCGAGARDDDAARAAGSGGGRAWAGGRRSRRAWAWQITARL